MVPADTIAAVDWTPVIVAGVTSICAAIPATIAAVASILNRRELRTSGDSVGKLVERTNRIVEGP